jgi:hypothetical protein
MCTKVLSEQHISLTSQLLSHLFGEITDEAHDANELSWMSVRENPIVLRRHGVCCSGQEESRNALDQYVGRNDVPFFLSEGWRLCIRRQQFLMLTFEALTQFTQLIHTIPMQLAISCGAISRKSR